MKKWGEVGLRQDENITKIFHANKKKIDEFKRLEDKIKQNKVQMVGSPTSYTQAQSLDGLVKNDSSSAQDIIPQNPKISQEILKESQKFQEALKIFCEQIKMNSLNDKNAQNKRLENLEKRFEILNKHNVFDENTTQKIKKDFQEIKTKIQSNNLRKDK